MRGLLCKLVVTDLLERATRVGSLIVSCYTPRNWCKQAAKSFASTPWSPRAISRTIKSCLMPNGLVMAEAMADRCVASATKWRNAASISDGSSSCGHRS